MATIADLTTNLSAPAAGDKLVARDVSEVSATKDKYLLLSQMGVLSLAQSWSAKQTFAAGIDFGNETLSVYDEGTWTPVVADATSGGNTGTAVGTNGYYIKIGKLCLVSCYIVDITTTGMTAGNTVYVRGLPFAASSSSNFRGANVVVVGNVTFSGYVISNLQAGTSYISFREATSGAASTALTVSDLTSTTADLIFTLSYLTD